MPHGPTGGRSALPPKAARRRGRGRRRSDERLHSAPPRGWTHLRPDLQQPGAFVVLDPFARGPTETYRLRLVYLAQFPCYVFPLGQEYELPRHKSRGGVRMRLRRVFSTPLSSASQDPSPPPFAVLLQHGLGRWRGRDRRRRRGFFGKRLLLPCLPLLLCPPLLPDPGGRRHPRGAMCICSTGGWPACTARTLVEFPG